MDATTVAVAGTWFRQVPAGADPFARPPHAADSRWQRASVVEAIYFADSEKTAWAEWYRALAEAAIPPQQALPRDLWRWEVDLPRVADLSDLEAAGLPELAPTRAQWPAFQAVGEALHADGWPALVAPSAARPWGRTLCIFRTGREVAGASPLPPPTRVEDPPLVPTGLRT